jgi:hypothetical protein
VDDADEGFAVGAEFGELVFVCCAEFLESRTHPAVKSSILPSSSKYRKSQPWSFFPATLAVKTNAWSRPSVFAISRT